MKRLAMLAGLLASFSAAGCGAVAVDDIRTIRELRAQLEGVRGTVVLAGGVDTNGALKKLADAIIAIDRRLSRLEK